jgi:hypothetical protein
MNMPANCKPPDSKPDGYVKAAGQADSPAPPCAASVRLSAHKRGPFGAGNRAAFCVHSSSLESDGSNGKDICSG